MPHLMTTVTCMQAVFIDFAGVISRSMGEYDWTMSLMH
jgi:hypothetical protein